MASDDARLRSDSQQNSSSAAHGTPHHGIADQGKELMTRLGAKQSTVRNLRRLVTDKGIDPASKPKPCWPNVPGARRQIFEALDNPDSSRAGGAISSLVLGTILASVTAFMLESLPEHRADPDRGILPKPAFLRLEEACIVIFTIEYLGRLLTVSAVPTPPPVAAAAAGAGAAERGGCSKVWHFVRSPMNVIDLLAILPFYVELVLAGDGGAAFAVVRILRLFRVFRVLKMGKFCHSMQMFGRVMASSSSALSLLVFFMAIGCTLFGSAVFFAEGGSFEEDVQDVDGNWVLGTGGKGCYTRPTLPVSGGPQGTECTPFVDIPSSFWWVMVTATTVGYGDMYPTTFWGKMVGVATFYFGILILALPITIIGANYADEYAKELDDEEQRLTDMLGAVAVEETVEQKLIDAVQESLKEKLGQLVEEELNEVRHRLEKNRVPLGVRQEVISPLNKSHV